MPGLSRLSPVSVLAAAQAQARIYTKDMSKELSSCRYIVKEMSSMLNRLGQKEKALGKKLRHYVTLNNISLHTLEERSLLVHHLMPDEVFKEVERKQQQNPRFTIRSTKIWKSVLKCVQRLAKRLYSTQLSEIKDGESDDIVEVNDNQLLDSDESENENAVSDKEDNENAVCDKKEYNKNAVCDKKEDNENAVCEDSESENEKEDNENAVCDKKEDSENEVCEVENAVCDKKEDIENEVKSEEVCEEENSENSEEDGCDEEEMEASNEICDNEEEEEEEDNEEEDNKEEEDSEDDDNDSDYYDEEKDDVLGDITFPSSYKYSANTSNGVKLFARNIIDDAYYGAGEGVKKKRKRQCIEIDYIDSLRILVNQLDLDENISVKMLIKNLEREKRKKRKIMLSCNICV